MQEQNNQKSGLSWQQPETRPLPMQAKPPVQTTVHKVEKSTPDKSNNFIWWAFGAGLLLGVLVTWGVVAIGGKQKAASPVDETKNSLDAGTSVSLNDTLVPQNPQDAGLEVTITRATVTAPTWLVVYESRGGVPGNALGAALFFPTAMGGKETGAVSLLRATLTGQTYFVGEALDDGDHKFSMQDDTVLRDQSGNPLWVSFETR